MLSFLVIILAFLACTSNAKDLSEEIEKIRVKYGVPALGGGYSTPKKSFSTTTGYKKITTTEPVSLSDIFHIGSDGKAMTATVAAICIEEGLLQWTSTLEELFPDIPLLHQEYRNVTIEMILAHRSGMPDVPDTDGPLWEFLYSPELDPTRGRSILTRYTLTKPPANPPGSTFLYSNTGYTMVGHIIERIFNQPWEKVIVEKLFQPLNITEYAIGVPLSDNEPTSNRPSPHVPSEEVEGTVEVIPWGPGADNPRTLAPAGTMSFTLSSWQKFLDLHLAGDLGQPTPVLTPASFQKLHTRYPGQDYTYGGWGRVARDWADGDCLTHNGSNNMNFATVWMALAKGIIVTSLSNCGQEPGQVAVGQTIDLLLLTALEEV